MKKAGAVLLIVMIQVATTNALIMAWTPPRPPTSAAKCPLDALKLGACVDVLSGLVHVALELIVACGKTVPPGFKCPAQ
ncbi:hypothetical protein SUGI_0490500 [Cryptomeria japonica]|nr:hypothetical protein SUGI_0490500 [Cryptomeria japonica]